MDTFINRLIRPLGDDHYMILVNGEHIATFVEYGMDRIKARAAELAAAAEARLDDFFFVITAWDEPEMGCTHTVTMAARGSGRVLESFTTDDPYGAVEAAREAQATTLEERFEMYAARGW